MINYIPIKNPYVISDIDNDMFYCYGDGGIMYGSSDFAKWEKIDCNLPKLCEPCAIKVKNEYRIYSVTDGGILLYTSNSPSANFKKRDFVTEDANDAANAAATFPSIFVDSKSGGHYLIYTLNNEGIFLLRLNPQNGLAYEEGRGINIAKRPSFNGRISQGCIFYNDDNGFYYLFVVYGGSLTGNIRVGRSRNVEGPYIDYEGYALTDINDFSGARGYLVSAPHLFDDMPVVAGYSRPCIINVNNSNTVMTCRLYLKDKEESVFGVENLIWNDDWPLLIPYGLIISDEQKHFAGSELCGQYEFIRYNKSLFQPMADYVALNILAPHEPGVSSTRNSWAMKVPCISNGRIELGGSHRGYWLYGEDGRIILNYGIHTEICQIFSVKNIMTDSDTILLIGTDAHGIVTIAKKYR